MAQLEIAIAVADRGPGRVQEGDIVVARAPLGYIGLKERQNLLWLLIETDETPEELMASDPASGRKRERFLSLDAMNGAGLSFDLARVRDETDDYQPGFDPDPASGVFRRQPPAAALDGLLQRRRP